MPRLPDRCCRDREVIGVLSWRGSRYHQAPARRSSTIVRAMRSARRGRTDLDLRQGSKANSELSGRQAKTGARTTEDAQPPLAASLYSASLTCVPQAVPCPCSPASDSARCENRRSGEAPCQCIVSGGMLTVSPGFSTCGFSPFEAYAADAGQTEERLPNRVGVPRGACARRERHDRTGGH